MFCGECGTKFEDGSQQCEKCGVQENNGGFKAIAPIFYDWGEGYFCINPAGWVFMMVSLVGGLAMVHEYPFSVPICLVPFIVLRAINETKWKKHEKANGKTVKNDWKNVRLISY